jgi:hypothetical protein
VGVGVVDTLVLLAGEAAVLVVFYLRHLLL